MKSWGVTLLVLGILAVLASFLMPTAAPGASVNNFGLMLNALSVRLVGLFSALGGVVLYAGGAIVDALRPTVAGPRSGPPGEFNPNP